MRLTFKLMVKVITYCKNNYNFQPSRHSKKYNGKKNIENGFHFLSFISSDDKLIIKSFSFFEKYNIIAIDMTPAKIGEFIVPAVNIEDIKSKKNINMITCGGQSSIPIAYSISQVVNDIEYIEIVSTISSKSAGPGTRANVDEYIETTEKALSLFTGCKNIKAIINLNPAIPSIDMQTTIYVKSKNHDIKKVKNAVNEMITKIKRYVPGYSLITEPKYINGIIMLTIKVQGAGDYLPKYAGNLDIINCAAIEVAEKIAKEFTTKGIN